MGNQIDQQQQQNKRKNLKGRIMITKQKTKRRRRRWRSKNKVDENKKKSKRTIGNQPSFWLANALVVAKRLSIGRHQSEVGATDRTVDLEDHIHQYGTNERAAHYAKIEAIKIAWLKGGTIILFYSFSRERENKWETRTRLRERERERLEGNSALPISTTTTMTLHFLSLSPLSLSFVVFVDSPLLFFF